MRWITRIVGIGVACCGIAGSAATGPLKPMSFHNRLLLNRLTIGGYESTDLLLLVKPSRFDEVAMMIARDGGQVRRSERAIGYLHADVPMNALASLLSQPSIEAYQIGGRLSHGAWYRDGITQFYAETYRDAEARSVATPASPDVTHESLPALPRDEAGKAGYTADEDAGVGAWFAEHPTYDGRGTTIAVIESALPEFAHPIMGSARNLDGTPVSKIAGIVSEPDEGQFDETRVRLGMPFDTPRTWQRIDSQTYILPKPGRYRSGIFWANAGSDVAQRVGVVRDEATGDIWIDTNGDRDFRNERPMRDINERQDVGVFRLTYPGKLDVGFVVSSGRSPDTLHIYLGRSSHQTLTVSVAAGSRSADGLAYGVAPAARVLLVRIGGGSFAGFIDACLDAMQRPDVDVVVSTYVPVIAPDADGEFGALFVNRLIETYHKPLVISAGNTSGIFATSVSFGKILSVGGSISPQGFDAFFGGGTPARQMVHPMSAAGPSIDGAIKPDILAPMNRIVADVCGQSPRGRVVPKNAPRWTVPPCYGVSTGTSSSAPYAAGVIALLISRAKQEHVPYNADAVLRAVRLGARFMTDTAAFRQGNGLLDVDGAWRELERRVESVQIATTGHNTQPLTPYAVEGAAGPGIFERDQWDVGMSGQRTIRLKRTTGPAGERAYRLSWTGNDGTFAAPPTVSLPLGKSIDVSIDIKPRSSGVHSALLNLLGESGEIIQRASAVVVCPERFRTRADTVDLSGSLPLLETANHFIAIPEQVTALVMQVDVNRGAISVEMTQPSGLHSTYGTTRPKLLGETLPKGRYTLRLPAPPAGTLNVIVGNHSAWREKKASLVSTDDAEYTIKVRLINVTADVTQDGGRSAIQFTNTAGAISSPQVIASRGTLNSYSRSLAGDGIADVVDILVPEGATSLRLRARMTTAGTSGLELYVYDCTSGECFLYDAVMPFRAQQNVAISEPRAGLWRIATNAAPYFPLAGTFVLDAIVTNTQPQTVFSSHDVWRMGSVKTVPMETRRGADDDGDRVAVYDIIDQGVDGAEQGGPDDQRVDRERAESLSSLGGLVVELSGERSGAWRRW